MSDRSGEDDEAVLAEFVGIAEDLLPTLIPEVMNCLPDWPTIEGKDATANDDGEAEA